MLAEIKKDIPKQPIIKPHNIKIFNYHLKYLI